MTAEVSAERISRWWLNRPPIQTIEQAEEYLDSVQFTQLFGRDGRYPSLREVSRDDDCERTPDGFNARVGERGPPQGEEAHSLMSVSQLLPR